AAGPAPVDGSVVTPPASPPPIPPDPVASSPESEPPEPSAPDSSSSLEFGSPDPSPVSPPSGSVGSVGAGSTGGSVGTTSSPQSTGQAMLVVSLGPPPVPYPTPSEISMVSNVPTSSSLPSWMKTSFVGGIVLVKWRSPVYGESAGGTLYPEPGYSLSGPWL